MKMVCLVKFVPDVEDEGESRILNPDDACALAFALTIKRSHPQTVIEVVTMAPATVRGELEDLVRRNIDGATLISDKRLGGSDTFATSLVLGSYLQQTDFDVILTGTHSLDGDTSQVPAQVGELCGLPQLSHVVAIDPASLLSGRALVEVDHESELLSFAVELPAILSLRRESGYKLPYVGYHDLNKDVSAQVRVVSLGDLGLATDDVGLGGSRTRVRRTFVKPLAAKGQVVVTTDEAGIETVYGYLKSRGLLP